MAKADTSVKWFHSGMVDAPVLSASTAGALINLLDACLLNGFGVRTPDSIVVADGVATVSIGAGNPYEKHAVVVISGASDAALNAEWRIATSGASSFTFLCPVVANGTVTGSSVKRAAAGWGKPFSDTNIAVYQSLDPNSTQLYLRIDDTATSYSSVRGYEQMTSATDGTGEFPTTAQIASLRWPRWGNTWAIIADGSFMWALLRGSNNPLMNTFGDLNAFKPNDKYHCTINGVNGNSTNGASHPGAGSNGSVNIPRVMARASSQLGGPVLSFVLTYISTDGPWAPNSTLIPETTFSGDTILGAPVFAHDGNFQTTPIRGVLPGAISSLNRLPFSNFSVQEAEGRAYLAVTCNTAINGAGSGIAIFDILGPWR